MFTDQLRETITIGKFVETNISSLNPFTFLSISNVYAMDSQLFSIYSNLSFSNLKSDSFGSADSRTVSSGSL